VKIDSGLVQVQCSFDVIPNCTTHIVLV